jgi:hypothetical protein
VVGKPGEHHPGHGVIPSQAINTMGEVLDGPWFVNRHWKKRMTADELTSGPGNDDPPSVVRPWQVLTVKRYDVRPGMFIADADNQLYLLHFDPPGRLELATGASMVASRAYYALGYWVPENYIVYFHRSQVSASPEGEDINAVGIAKKLLEDDIDLFLTKVAVDPQRGYRAVATKVPRGEPVGPYSFYGVRTDDPNDIYAHEHRRDQRGLFVYSAWLANNWIRPLATFDFLVEENGLSFIRHYIVDFLAPSEVALRMSSTRGRAMRAGSTGTKPCGTSSGSDSFTPHDGSAPIIPESGRSDGWSTRYSTRKTGCRIRT